eukprot:5469302-Alexandrium_andersonii.AAC.1
MDEKVVGEHAWLQAIGQEPNVQRPQEQADPHHGERASLWDARSLRVGASDGKAEVVASDELFHHGVPGYHQTEGTARLKGAQEQVRTRNLVEALVDVRRHSHKICASQLGTLH